MLSLCRWQRLYFHTAYTRRRSYDVRAGIRALESSAKCREGHFKRDIHACGYVTCDLSMQRLFLMISALLLINEEPNLESGANIDCCKLYRDNRGVRSALLLVTSHLLTQVEGI